MGKTSYTVQAGKDEITFEAPDGLTDAQITQIADQHLSDAKPGQSFQHSLMDPNSPRAAPPAEAPATGDIQVNLPEPKSELMHNLSAVAGTAVKGVSTGIVGLGDLADFAAHNNRFTGFPKTLDQYEATDAMAPKLRNWMTQNLGLDEPTSSVGRVLDAVGESIIGGPRKWGAAAAGALGGLVSGLTGEAGGSTEAQLLAGLVASHSPKLAAQGARHLIRGDMAPQIGQAIQDFGQAGTSPSMGQAMDTPKMLLKEQGANTAPFAGSDLAVQRSTQQTAIGQKIGSVVDSLAGGKAPTPTEAGQGFVQNFKDKFKTAQGALRDSKQALYDKLVSPDTLVDAGPIRDTISGHAAAIPGMENLSQDPMIRSGLARLDPAAQADFGAQFSDILDAEGKPILKSNSSQIPVSSIKAMKQRIGEMLSTAPIDANGSSLNANELSHLYKTLSQTERSAALTADGGKPGMATQLWEQNNADSVKYFETLKQVRKAVNAATGEDTYRNLVLGSGYGSTKLNAAYSTLDQTGKQFLSAAILKNKILKPSDNNAVVGPDGLSSKAGDNFSINDTLKNWAHLSDAERTTIMSGMGPGYAKNFQTILSVMQKVQTQNKNHPMPLTPTKGFGGLATTSLIGGEGYAVAYGHKGLAALLATVTTGIAAHNRILPKLMASPKGAAWLARTNDIPAKSLPVAIRQLGIISARSKDKDLADAVAELQQGSE